jgi:hypothetical protein
VKQVSFYDIKVKGCIFCENKTDPVVLLFFVLVSLYYIKDITII